MAEGIRIFRPTQEQQHPPGAVEDFDVTARIEQLEAYLEDPRFDKQKDNIEAVLHYYREGLLPVKYGEPLVFQGGRLIELSADNLMNDEMIWFEEVCPSWPGRYLDRH